MNTINNKYNVGETVFYVEENKIKSGEIKSGEITAIIYRDTDFFNYIINTNLDIWYIEEVIAKTPEKALENYIADCRTREMSNIGKKYDKLEKEIYENWCK